VLPQVLARLVLEYATLGALGFLIAEDDRRIGHGGANGGGGGGGEEIGLGDVFGRARAKSATMCATWWRALYVAQLHAVQKCAGEGTRGAVSLADADAKSAVDVTRRGDDVDRMIDAPSAVTDRLHARICAADVAPALVDLLRFAIAGARRQIAQGRIKGTCVAQTLDVVASENTQQQQQQQRQRYYYPVNGASWALFGDSLLEFDFDRSLQDELIDCFRVTLSLSSDASLRSPVRSARHSRRALGNRDVNVGDGRVVAAAAEKPPIATRLELTLQLEPREQYDGAAHLENFDAAAHLENLRLAHHTVDCFLNHEVLPLVLSRGDNGGDGGDGTQTSSAEGKVETATTPAVAFRSVRRTRGVDPDFVVSGDADRDETVLAFARIIAALRHGLAPTSIHVPLSRSGTSTSASRSDYVDRVTRAFPGIAHDNDSD
jgi:hypothetical protein